MLDSVAIFDFQASFWETQKWYRQTPFFQKLRVKFSDRHNLLWDSQNSRWHDLESESCGQRFLIDKKFQRSDKLSTALKIEKIKGTNFVFFDKIDIFSTCSRRFLNFVVTLSICFKNMVQANIFDTKYIEFFVVRFMSFRKARNFSYLIS